MNILILMVGLLGQCSNGSCAKQVFIIPEKTITIPRQTITIPEQIITIPSQIVKVKIKRRRFFLFGL